ncbi:MAG: hypothetical protein ACRDMJ_02015, partial [Solirubrobacteraceae bacterium]
MISSVGLLLVPAAATAGATCSQRSIAGVHATLSEYAGDLITGDAHGACGILTAAAQRAIVRDNHAASCKVVVEASSQLLKSSPHEAAALRSSARTVKVTLHGDTARADKFDGAGTVSLDSTLLLGFLAGGCDPGDEGVRSVGATVRTPRHSR